MSFAHYACGSKEHGINRRRFLQRTCSTAVAGTAVVGGLGSLTAGKAAEQLKSQDMRVVVFNMHGGLSQLESWDPKPGTRTGGPCRSIPTSVPGIHISDLLPNTAKQMHHLCLLRGVNTAEDDHGKGAYMMLTGRRQSAAADYPQIGAVSAKMLNDESKGLPGHIVVAPSGGGGRGNESAYLGPKYSSVALSGSTPPPHTLRPDGISEPQTNGHHRRVHAQLRASASVDGTTRCVRHFQRTSRRFRSVRKA